MTNETKECDHKSSQTEDIKKSSNRIGIFEILGGIILLCIGLSIGLWISANDYKHETMRLKIEYAIQIEEEREAWEKERENENVIEAIHTVLKKAKKEEGKRNENK